MIAPMQVLERDETAPALREDGAGQQVGQLTLERLPFETRLVAKLDAEQRADDPFTTLAPSARGFTEQLRDLGPHQGAVHQVERQNAQPAVVAAGL